MKRLINRWHSFEEWASSIKADKLLHYIAGKELCAVSTIIAMIYFALFGETASPARIIAISAPLGCIVGILAGFAKDYIVDKYGDGRVDFDDFLATTYGGVSMCLEIEAVALVVWVLM